MWIYIDCFDTNEEMPPQKLFQIRTELTGVGVESYLIRNKLYYRAINGFNDDKSEATNGISLYVFQPKQWYYLGLDHEGPKVLQKSYLNVIFALRPDPLSAERCGCRHRGGR